MNQQAADCEVGSGGGARERDARQPARVGAENRDCEVGSGGGVRERDARQPARVGAENRRSQG